MADRDDKKSKPNVFQQFFRETMGELRKVTWPTPQEAWNLTKIVLIVLAAMSAVLGLLDYGFSLLVTRLVS